MPDERRDLIQHGSGQLLDRAALERVLARATELQAGVGETGDLLSERQLLDIGKEVGISPRFLQQALAEERTRPDMLQGSSRMTRYFGPARIVASRVVRGKADGVLQSMDRWMQKEELLQIKRRFPDMLTWEPRRDFLGSIRRGFNVGGRGYSLSSAEEVGCSVSRVDDDSVLVQLVADYSAARSKSAVAGGSFFGVAATFSGLGLLVASTLGGSLIIAGGAAAVSTLLGVGSAFAFAKQSRELIARGQLSLEQALDRLEHGRTPAGPTLEGLLNAAVRELK